ncbi:MAG: hypothetical protein QNK35_06070 [Bacteroides sp.]|nr:hypothetical protein [Bacteroides sp.]
MKSVLICGILLFVLMPFSSAQHEEREPGDQHAEHDGLTHKVTLVMANSFLKNQVDQETDNVLVVPTYGLNYDFSFHPRWGVGFHSDIVLQQYKVENHDNHEVLVRENPVALCVVGQYKPITPLTIIAGYGIELEKHENIQLFRLGLEYGFHLPKNWELGIALEYDWKFSTYSSWVFGVGFSKLFMKKT